MLSLRNAAGQFIPLPKKFALGFNFISNVLNISEKVDPSFVLPITVPNTAAVSEMIGYGSDPQSDYDLSAVLDGYSIMIDQNEFWPGALEIVSADDDEVKMNFRFASGYIPTVNDKIDLKDFFTDVSITITGGTTKTYTIVWPGDLKDVYRLSINATLYTETVLSEFDDAADYLTDLATQAEGNADVYSASFDTDTYVMTIVGVQDATLSIGAETELDLVTVVISPITLSTAFNISFPDLGTIYRLPTMYIPNLFDGRSNNFSGFVNLYNDGNYVYDRPSFPADAFTTIIPRIRTKWMLDYLFSAFGIELTGTYKDDAEWSERLEFTPRPIHKEIYEQDTEEGFSIEIPVSEFLPDISLSDWLLSLKAEPCMSITFDSGDKVASMNLVKAVLADNDYEDWTAYLVKMGNAGQVRFNGLQLGYELDSDDLRIKNYARKRETFGNLKTAVATLAILLAIDDDEVNAIRFVESKNAFYRFMKKGLEVVYTWQFWSYNLDDYREGNEGLKVKSAYTPLVNDLVSYEGDWTSTMWLPYVDVVGYMPQMDLNNNSFPPRFDIYRGLQHDVEAASYPMSSMGIHKANESLIDGANFCLSPAVHTANKTAAYFAEWIALQKDLKFFPASFNLPLAKLQRIDSIKKIRVLGVNFLVESFSGEIENRGVNLVETKLIRA